MGVEVRSMARHEAELEIIWAGDPTEPMDAPCPFRAVGLERTRPFLSRGRIQSEGQSLKNLNIDLQDVEAKIARLSAPLLLT